MGIEHRGDIASLFFQEKEGKKNINKKKAEKEARHPGKLLISIYSALYMLHLI